MSEFTVTGSASISACGRYRYALERRVPDIVGPNLCWLMLNPSTADATRDDPTIRKVMGFTRRNGYGVALVVNLFAIRETEPKNVRAQLADAEGADNCAAVMQAAEISDAVVCAWGAHPWARKQAVRVLEWLAEHPREMPIRLLCLGTSKDGDPLHPLMPSYDGHPLRPFVRAGGTLPWRRSGLLRPRRQNLDDESHDERSARSRSTSSARSSAGERASRSFGRRVDASRRIRAGTMTAADRALLPPLRAGECYACRIDRMAVPRGAAFLCGIAFVAHHSNEAIKAHLCPEHLEQLVRAGSNAASAIPPNERRGEPR